MTLDLAIDDLDVVSSLLWDLGTTGVANVVPDASPPGETGTSGPPIRLVAGFETEPEASAAARRLPSSLLQAPPRVDPVDPSGWVDGMRRTTVEVGGRTIAIAPGGAFGDGGHPTTRLALELLDRTMTGTGTGTGGVGRSVPGPTLDFGAGTGILALAALARGAPSVTAIEHDAAARAALARTVALNRELVAGRSPIVRQALDPGDGPFTLVLANVLAPVHRAWGAELGRRLAPGGRLIVTGFLVGQETEVAAGHPGRSTVDRLQDDDWLGLVLA